MSRETPFGKHINELFQTNPSLAAEEELWSALTPPNIVVHSEADLQYMSKATAGWIYAGPNKMRLRTYTFDSQEPSYDPNNCKTVILGTSFGNTSAAMLKFVPPLLSAGLRVVLYDHIGHGESDGEIYEIFPDLDAVSQLARLYAPLIGSIGFSIGGFIPVGVLTFHPDIICPRLVSIGAGTSFWSVIGGHARRKGIRHEVIEKAFHRAKELGVYLNDDLKDDVDKAPLLPKEQTKALIIHDLHDPISPFENAIWLSRMFEDTRLVGTKGNKHFGALRSDAVVKIATDFVIQGNAKTSFMESKI